MGDINVITISKSLAKYNSFSVSGFLYDSGWILFDGKGNTGASVLTIQNRLNDKYIYEQFKDGATFELVASIDGLDYVEPKIVVNDDALAFIFRTPGCYIVKGTDVSRTPYMWQVNGLLVKTYNVDRIRDYEPYHEDTLQPRNETSPYASVINGARGSSYKYDYDAYVFYTEDGYSWCTYNHYYSWRLDELGSLDYLITDYDPTVNTSQRTITFDKEHYQYEYEKIPQYIVRFNLLGTNYRVINGEYVKANLQPGYGITGALLAYTIAETTQISYIRRVGGKQLFCYLEDGTVIPFQRTGKNLYGYGKTQLHGLDYGSYMLVSIDGGEQVKMDYWQKRNIYVPAGGD